MSWQTLRPQVKTLIDSISTIQEVVGYPKIKFRGYPAANVTPSDNTADYETTTENVRTYVFNVRLFYETKKKGIEGSLEALEKIVDSVLDKVDQEDLKGSTTRTVGVSLPSGYTFLNIWATPAAWGQIDGEALLMADLTIGIRLSRDIA